VHREARIGLRSVSRAKFIIHVGERGIHLVVPIDRLDRLFGEKRR
jgi:hypothetical protein